MASPDNTEDRAAPTGARNNEAVAPSRSGHALQASGYQAAAEPAAAALAGSAARRKPSGTP